MSASDVMDAKRALGWRLHEWGCEEAFTRASGFIDELVSRGWVMDPKQQKAPRFPRTGQACRTCGRVFSQMPPCCDAPADKPPTPGTRPASTRRDTTA